VTESGAERLDIGILGGIVAALAPDLEKGSREIDARARLVLPGGVDVHCHVDQRSSSGLLTADDFFTAGISAACGGTTTIVPFAAQHRGNSLRAVVDACHAGARQRAFVDYGLHLIISDPTADVLQRELPALVAEGCPSLKIYMTYDALKINDRQMLEIFETARKVRAMVMVHAENSDVVAWATERTLSAGRSEPRYHPASRPAAAEAEATNRAIALAGLAGADLFIVHVSCREALAAVVAARARGARVWAETCPQYLVLEAADMDNPGFDMARFICSPPLRTSEDQAALWDALASGQLDLVSSDHAPYRLRDPLGKLVHGETAPFHRIPNGIPGLELRLPLIYSEGVRRGWLSLLRFVELTSTSPARIFGLYPRKGTIAVGSDADLVVWDPERMAIVSQTNLHDAMDDTPYEGRRITGWPVTTISRGEVVWHEGKVQGEPGRGSFIKRSPR